MTTKAISRTIAVPDRAIWQIRQTGLPEEAGLTSTEAGTLSPRRPQKWEVWMVVDSRTVPRHNTARQLSEFVGRFGRFTVLDTAQNLDATLGPVSGPEGRIWTILASNGASTYRPDLFLAQ